MISQPRVDQLVAGFADGDAISGAAILMRDHLHRLGRVSEIFADPAHVTPCMSDQCRDHRAYDGGPADILIYHYSIGSAVTATFDAAAARRVLLYHNITPMEYFRGFDDIVAAQLATARAELAAVARTADAVWADSQYNAAEMAALGIGPVHVFPLPFAPAPGVPDDPAVRARFSGGLTNILFVGRVAPNKHLEDLIQAFAWYQQTIDHFSRLILVGSEHGCPRYHTMLRMLAGDLDLPNVCFTGFVAPASLPTFYRLADVFVCASEHEGYGLPLVEAMHARVPVIARRAGGTPESMGDAGVLYDDLSHAELAELIHLAVRDRTLREEILASQDARVRAIANRDMEGELQSLLDRIPSGVSPLRHPAGSTRVA